MTATTRKDIVIGVQLLNIIPRTNPTISGLRIYINALNDWAKEADNIGETDLSCVLRLQSENAAKQLREVSEAVRHA